MKLDTYIASSIFAYPSLYCRNNKFEWSKLAVLNQLFLVCGNGIDFVPNGNKGYFSENYPTKKFILKEKDVQRVLRGDTLAVIYSELDMRVARVGYLHGKYESKSKTVFLSDLTVADKKFLVIDNKHHEDLNIDKMLKEYKIFAEVYNEVYYDDADVEWRPYPFSLKHSSLHDDKANSLVDPSLIAHDWKEGIVEIYTEAKEWFEDDKRFSRDRHFNWVGDGWQEDDKNWFIKNWNNQPDKLKFCDEYAIPRKEYANPKAMAEDVVCYQRIKYIEDCNKVIQLYSQ